MSDYSQRKLSKSPISEHPSQSHREDKDDIMMARSMQECSSNNQTDDRRDDNNELMIKAKNGLENINPCAVEQAKIKKFSHRPLRNEINKVDDHQKNEENYTFTKPSDSIDNAAATLAGLLS